MNVFIVIIRVIVDCYAIFTNRMKRYFPTLAVNVMNVTVDLPIGNQLHGVQLQNTWSKYGFK